MELVGFVDIGSVKTNENPFIAGANRRNLSGGGIGLNWNAPNPHISRIDHCASEMALASVVWGLRIGFGGPCVG